MIAAWVIANESYIAISLHKGLDVVGSSWIALDGLWVSLW